MIATTEAYKDAVIAHTQEWSARATIDYTDYNLDNSISPSVSISDRQSRDDQLADGIEVTTHKFFPSWDRFTWGAGYHFRSESITNNERGALSYQLSDSSNDFNEYTGSVAGYAVAGSVSARLVSYPIFSLTFSERTVASLKIVFDSRLTEWANTFDVNIYSGSTLNHTENITGNTTYRYEKTLASPELLATKIEIIIYDWNFPLSKAKIIESFTSIQESYDVSDIISLAIYEESESSESTIPIGNVTANTCNLSVINEIMENDLSRFDNDNPLSVLAGNITRNRRIQLFLTLADQEIQLGTFYSQKWKIKESDLEVEVSGRDLITLMEDQEYTNDQFISPQANVIVENYNTTAEFNTFTLDNTIVGTDNITMGGSAVSCNGIMGSVAGYTVFGSVPTGTLYCGTSEKTISFTYTPGASVTVDLSYTGSIPDGTGIKLLVSYKAIEDFTEVDGLYTFTPEDISNTSQQIKIRALLYSQSVTVTPTIDSIIVDADELVTLYSIASKVIDDFNDITGLVDGNFSIDNSFGNFIIPNAYLEPQTYKSILKLVAEAGAGRAYIDRDGGIKLVAIESVSTSAKDYTKSSYFEKDQLTNPESLFNRVTVVTQPLLKAVATSTLATLSVDFGSNQDIVVSWDDTPSEWSSFESVAGLTVNSSTKYTWGVELNVSNTDGGEATLEMEIYGYVYSVTGSKRVTLDNTESIRKNGVLEYLIQDNPLIQTETQANLINTTLINSYEIQKRQAIIDALPDPSLKVGDSVTIDEKYYIISNNEIDFSGGQLLHQIGGKS